MLIFKKRNSEEWYWLFAVISIAFTGVAFGLVDADFYWQSKLGMSELTLGDFSCSDLLWGTEGLGTYLDHEWLCNILFYIWRTPFMAKCMICLISGVLLGRLIKPDFIRLFVLLLYFLLFCRVKAASFTVLFLCLELYVLNFKRVSECWANLLGIVIIWNNFHSGSVILFFLVLGAWILFECQDKKNAVLMFLVCMVSLLINPYGVNMVIFDVQHILAPGMAEVVRDWHPLDCSAPMGWVTLFFCVFAIFCEYESRAWRRIAVVGICIMAFKSERFGVYLFPFIFTSQREFLKYDIKAGVLCLTLGVLGLVSGFRGGEQYNFNYGERFNGIIRGGDGLFNDSDVTAGLDIQGFVNGAYPLCQQRTLDSLVLRYYGGEESISRIIDYYGLDRFVFCKYNMQCSFYNVTNPLYDYLSSRPEEYKCVYDDGMFVYFESIGG